jgi:hypothetical protein
MAEGYIALVGGENVVSVKSSDNTTVIPLGTINGEAAVGRQGSMKTSVLVSCNVGNVEAPSFYLEVACPPGFSTPASNLDDFDFTELIPIVSLMACHSGFTPGAPPLNAWPSNLNAYFATSFMAPIPVMAARIFAASPPSALLPYGSLTYQFFGSTTIVGPGSSGCFVSATIDFSHSIAN